jgi:hypothetical protein
VDDRRRHPRHHGLDAWQRNAGLAVGTRGSGRGSLRDGALRCSTQ